MWHKHVDYLNTLLGPGWQDYVISGGQWLFILALLPALRAKEKPPVFTSLLTAAIVSSFSYAFATLALVMSTFSSAIVAVMWYLLAYQKWRQ